MRRVFSFGSMIEVKWVRTSSQMVYKKGSIAQLVEHLPLKEMVESSSLSGLTFSSNCTPRVRLIILQL